MSKRLSESEREEVIRMRKLKRRARRAPAMEKLQLDWLNDMDLTLTFSQTRSMEIQLKTVKQSLYGIRQGKTDLLESILQTDLGKGFNCSTFQISLIDREPFIAFKRNRKHINRLKLFTQGQNITENKSCLGKKRNFLTQDLCKDQVHSSQIRRGISIVLHKVMSNRLIGHGNNKKKILKAFSHFLQTAQFEPFSLLHLIKIQNIESISWLVQIKDKQIKYILLAKFIKWLFLYIIITIYCTFHIAYIKGERVFIFKQLWEKQKKKYITKLKKKLILVQDDNFKTKKAGKLFLQPKLNGMRSIVKARYNDEEKDNLKKVQCILKYLYQNTFRNKNKNFSRTFLNIAGDRNKNVTNKLYITSADMRDAYGSIAQDKLINILQDMFSNLPDKLSLESYMHKGSIRYRYMDNIYVLNIQKNLKVIFLSKTFVLGLLEKLICNFKISINSKIYNICKGLAQGSIISPILCDIYCAHMRTKHFAEFDFSGELFVYVDDSIFLTRDLSIAQKYLKKIKNGIPEYNFWINELKLKTNVGKENHSLYNKAEFLGWKINLESFEIEPTLKKARYSISYTSLDSLKRLEFKLKNVNSLKLNELVLCKDINSTEKIKKNVRAIGIHQAQRCFALMIVPRKNKIAVENVYIFIHKTIFKIIRMVKNLSKWDEEEIKQNQRFLYWTMWKSFFHVFSKKRESFPDLCTLLKRMVKKYSKK